MYDSAFAIIGDAARKENIGVDDQRTLWMPTTCYMVMDLFMDNNKEVYARFEGITFYYRELFKEHDGKFARSTRHWECSPSVLAELIPKLCIDGVPLFGTFNLCGSYTEVLVKHNYKKTSTPSCLTLEEDAEAWEFV